eukprot:comp23100_c0_seq1/m.37122 comp23100_c0_seq1/g.37122  ORF comp23100_c0_seq1/g.37122 comp23100_c0_seq1/m.37122 type:complete len:733 (-) comp23100_c0_seq1:140-2338(-)
MADNFQRHAETRQSTNSTHGKQKAPLQETHSSTRFKLHHTSTPIADPPSSSVQPTPTTTPAIGAGGPITTASPLTATPSQGLGMMMDKIQQRMPQMPAMPALDLKLPGRTPTFPEPANTEDTLVGNRILLKGVLNYHEMGMWWLRYMVLTDEGLHWFKMKDNSLGEHERKTRFDEMAEVTLPKKEKYEGAFDIRLKQGGSEKLCARNAEERDLWINTLNEILSGDVDESWRATLGAGGTTKKPQAASIIFISTGPLDNRQGKGDVVCSTFPQFGDAIPLTLGPDDGVRVWMSDGGVYNIDARMVREMGGTTKSNGAGVEKWAATPTGNEDGNSNCFQFSVSRDPGHSVSSKSLSGLRGPAFARFVSSAETENETGPQANDSRLVHALCMLVVFTTTTHWLEGVFGSLVGLRGWGMLMCSFYIVHVMFGFPVSLGGFDVFGRLRSKSGPGGDVQVSEFEFCVALVDTEKEGEEGESANIHVHQRKSSVDIIAEQEQVKVAELQKDFPDYRPITIRRFLRGRKGDVAAARDMLRHDQEFRVNLGPLNFKDLIPELKWGFFYFHGRAKDGTPVLIFRVGNLFVKESQPDRLIKLMFLSMEQCFSAYPEGECATAICDFEDFSIRKNVDLGLYKRLMNCVADHLPEIIRRVIVVNTSHTVFYIWNTLKTLVDPTTIEKIKFLPENKYGEILRYVDAANLPRKYGGTGTYDPDDCVNACPEDPHWGSSNDLALQPLP